MENIVFVNQVGYKTFGKKYAYIAVEKLSVWLQEGFDASKLYFSIYDLNDRFVYTGTLSAPVKDILAGEFPSIDILKNTSLEELSNVEGIGDIIAKSIYNYFHNENNIKLIEELKELGINPQGIAKVKSNKLIKVLCEK